MRSPNRDQSYRTALDRERYLLTPEVQTWLRNFLFENRTLSECHLKIFRFCRWQVVRAKVNTRTSCGIARSHLRVFYFHAPGLEIIDRKPGLQIARASF